MLSDVSILEFLILAFAAMFIGFGKAGVAGAGMVTIPIFAAVLGGKPSTGFILPLLIIADIAAILYYRKNTRWDYLIKLSPWVLVGIAIATITGKYISDSGFNNLLAIVILLGVVLMLLKDLKKIPAVFFENSTFTILMGILGGFSSMIGNAAGTIMSIYLLSIALQKKQFIATRAWFFFLINLIKIPLHFFYWGTITKESLIDDAKLVTFIGLGMLLGFWAVKKINEQFFKKMVLLLVIASAISLLLS